MIKDQLIAHRGWQRHYPENTLLSVGEALKAGAKHIEIDIQLTADHIPVLCHDQHLQRVCNHPANINHHSWKELSALSAYEPQRLGNHFIGTPLSRLSECIDLISAHEGVTLYVEIKEESLHEFGPDLMRSTVLPMLDKIRSQCFVISFDIDILHCFKDHQWLQVAPVLSNWQQAFSPDLSTLQPPLVFCDIDLFNDCRSPSDLPYPCAIYEVDNYQKAHKLIQHGAALIESFAIGELINEDKTQC